MISLLERFEPSGKSWPNRNESRARIESCPRVLKRSRILVSAALVSLLMGGCNRGPKQLPVFPVEGKVVFQGQAPSGANLVLIPQGQDALNLPRPSAVVQPDGSFKIRTYADADGAPAGKYKVTLQWYKPVKQNGEFVVGKNLLPARYSDPQKSELEIEVAANTTNQIPPLKLVR